MDDDPGGRDVSAIGGGYNCYRCGAWIAESQTHTCSGAKAVYSPPAWTAEDKAHLFRVLDRIVELLERIVGDRR